MSTFLELDKAQRDFITGLNSRAISRERLTSLCLGKALADELPLPAQALKDAASTYRLEHSIAVRSILANVNEMVLLDLPTCAYYVERFYLWRYSVAYAPALSLSMDEDDAIADFVGLVYYVDKESLDTLKANRVQAAALYNGARPLFRALLSKGS